ncbi:NAD(P)-binding protein [Delitschia confertaspora ATCC 74209]|uniref:NAD(P)-binding protein n=1 Tax=Delitschia confertaspora ATCC 74209 TaxID=1513339 RepID=A0A9P4JIM5_9PLEO|nr:NAD(P)-binding protein [Delitschia confertaspora ATCC 74209]
MAPWCLVSPASRGIGFALAKKLLQTTTAPIVATARNDPERMRHNLLEGLDGVDKKRLTAVKVDFLDENTIENAAVTCKELFASLKLGPSHLQLGFIAPGVLFPERSPSRIDVEKALLTFRTNTIGPMLMLKHFTQFLPKKMLLDCTGSPEDTNGLPPVSAIVVMSARVGSISDNRLGGWYSYRASKAGVNQLVKTFDNHLRSASGDNAMVIALHPGTVKTDLSKEFWENIKKEKLFERDWVAAKLIDVVKSIGVDGRGRCWDFNGREVPP